MTLGKAQIVRLVDIFLLGPFMLYYALATTAAAPPLQVALLAAAGIATILYNGYYYLRIAGLW
jgi:hypothetical protein